MADYDYDGMASEFDSMEPDEQAKLVGALDEKDRAGLMSALDAKHSGKSAPQQLKMPQEPFLRADEPKPRQAAAQPFNAYDDVSGQAKALINGAFLGTAGKVNDLGMAAIKHPIDFLSGGARLLSENAKRDFPAASTASSMAGPLGGFVLQNGIPRASEVVPGASDESDEAYTQASNNHPMMDAAGGFVPGFMVPTAEGSVVPRTIGRMATGMGFSEAKNVLDHGANNNDIPEAALSGLGNVIVGLGGDALGAVWSKLGPMFKGMSDNLIAHHLGIPQTKVAEMKAAGEFAPTMDRVRQAGILDGALPQPRGVTHVRAIGANDAAQSELGASHGAVDLSREALGQPAPTQRDVSDFVKDSAFRDVQNGDVTLQDLDKIRGIADEKIIPSLRGKTVKEALGKPQINKMGAADYSPNLEDTSLAHPPQELLSKNEVPKYQGDNSGLRRTSDMNGERFSAPDNETLASEMWWKHKGEPPTNNKPGDLSGQDPWFRPPPNSNSAAGQREVGALELHKMAADLEQRGGAPAQNVADSYRAAIADQVGGVSREDPRIAEYLGGRIDDASAQAKAMSLAKNSLDARANVRGPGYASVAGEIPKPGIMSYPTRALGVVADLSASGGAKLSNWLSKATSPERIAKFATSPFAAASISRLASAIAADKNPAVMHYVTAQTNPEYNSAFLRSQEEGGDGGDQ